MLLFIFLGFFIGFFLSLRFVRRPRRALIRGAVLGAVPLVLMLGPGNAPVQGIGSALNFAFFALGPLMLIPIVVGSAALGVAGAAVVLWIGHGRARWVGWALGGVIIVIVAMMTLLPVAQREMAKRQLANDRGNRAEAIIRADFEGTLAGYQVSFPASPRLHLSDDCAPGVQAGLFGCSTSLTNPVTILTGPDETLLNERSDPISFRTISVGAVETDCTLGDFCLTQEQIDHWCGEVRSDQADGIWCRDMPPMRFSLRTDATPGPSDRDEPELAARYANTRLGTGRVVCFYSPDTTETDRQGASCKISFDLADGVKASLSLRRTQIISDDPALTATIELIPEYWSALTDG
ncbi:hypothetical protein KMP13_15065 [Epibacterium ulvae]|uniref:hypothetical protein n=1 Tax=Epibacterium ulvae TaxID=1156985 RepID=UPI001BFCCA00|nr:hypothetical protein [Epibacterium ulvae]MBT8155166.1 hypothetical protein [Epibacterium ulvae]